MAKFRGRYTSQNYRDSDSEEDILLYKKLVRSILGIILVSGATILSLQFFGPKIFSVFSFLSIDRWMKTEKPKLQTNPPVFIGVPKATRQRTISIEGFTEAQGTVKLFVNGPEVATATADSDGKFTFPNLSLVEGQNIIFARSTAPNKTESEKSNTSTVIYDLNAPQIVVISPKDGDTIESVDSRITIKGVVNEEATVSVNTHVAIVDNDGNFQALISVSSGENKIKVLATDTAGNQATSSIKITFNKR